jgi:hypothetical protein
MCKEMPVIPVNKVVDLKKNNRKKWRAEEEERHKGSLTQKKNCFARFAPKATLFDFKNFKISMDGMLIATK